MSNSKNKSSGDELGGWIIPVMDLLSFLLMKGTEQLTRLMIYLTNRYIFNRESRMEIKKIERKDIRNKKSTLKDEDLGYSVTNKRPIELKNLERGRHSVVVGASGFGKTVLLDVLMYDDMRNDKPVIFIDPKGDNKSMRQFINLCKLSGREYSIFSEHYTGEGEIKLNPVKEGSPTHIADRIHESFDWSEEHYEVLCYRALKTAIKLLQEKTTDVSLESIKNKLEEISDKKNKSFMFKRDNIEGIIARLENLIDTDFGPKLIGNGFSFKEVWEQKKCVYIGLPVLGYAKTAKALGKMIYGDLSHTVYEQYKISEIMGEHLFAPQGVYIDELSAIIDDRFIEILNKCRGIKMELTFAYQSPSDIAKISEHLNEQILENTSNWFVLKQRLSKSAEFFSSSIGTLEGKKLTVRVDDGLEQSMGSQRNVEEMISHPNIIKNLDRGQCILLRHSPTQIDLVNIKYINPVVAQENVSFAENIGDLVKEQPMSADARSC